MRSSKTPTRKGALAVSRAARDPQLPGPITSPPDAWSTSINPARAPGHAFSNPLRAELPP